MEYRSENKICQNCKKDFTIEPEDFNFYEKIKVPPPTWCPECRFIRRMVWRNEKTLYKRTCDMCKKNVLSMYPQGVSFPVYCRECWYGDKWDGITFGQDYDFSKTFFKQFKELQRKVPRIALWQRETINSEYSNMVGESKNVYLSASVVLGSENVFYSRNIDTSFNIIDSYNLKHCENCYETIEGARNYNSQYLFLCRNCIDSLYSIDCVNCSNCLLSYNLRNKKFCIKNKQYSETEYFKELEKINLKSRKSRNFLMKEYLEIKQKAIYRFANIVNSYNSTGHNILNMKNCINCFDVYDGENFKYCYRAFTSKDCMDYSYGQTSELMYEYVTGALSDYNVRFSYTANNTKDAEYTDFCISSNNLFGCIGVRNKKNVILNKVYTEKEFTKLREEIIKHMNDFPYVDGKGRVYKYGEFFPMEISPFSYNETQAQDFKSISKIEAERHGYLFKEEVVRDPKIATSSEDIPDDISQVDDSILSETLGCADKNKCKHKCTIAFIITKGELEFYKKNKIPLPNKCPNCRSCERFNQVPLPNLYHRKCMKEGCKNEFETPYAPDRPEIVYCENCYNREVY